MCLAVTEMLEFHILDSNYIYVSLLFYYTYGDLSVGVSEACYGVHMVSDITPTLNRLNIFRLSILYMGVFPPWFIPLSLRLCGRSSM